MGKTGRDTREGGLPDPRREEKRTRGFDQTRFASSGRRIADLPWHVMARWWDMPVALLPREERRRVGEGWA